MVHARTRTTPVHALLALLAVAMVAVAPADHAFAAPSQADLEKQINQAWEKLEPTIEQYNGVHEELKANRAKAADLQRKLQPLELQVDLALASIGAVAAQAYRGGPAANINALLSGSPTALGDRLSMLDYLARRQRAEISSVADLRDKYAGQKKTLDDLIATQAKWSSAEVRGGSFRLPGGGVVEVEAAGAVEGFFGGADRGAVG